jgi:hypothetical protein
MLLPLSLVRCLLWLSTLVTALLQLSTPLLACAPPPPDLWFSERITTVATDLPAGVGLRVIQFVGRYNRLTHDDQTRDFVEITNRSSTPLYVLAAGQNPLSTFTNFPMALPPRVGAIYQIVNDQVFTWDPMLNAGIYPQSAAGSPQTRPTGWVASGAKPSDGFLSTISGNDILRNEILRDNEYATNGEAVVIRPAVQNRFGDARPANVHLPRAEIIRVSLIAGTQLIQVPITVSFVLNPSYRPDSMVHQVYHCGEATIFPKLLWCLIVTIVLVAGGVIYERHRTRAPTTSAIP